VVARHQANPGGIDAPGLAQGGGGRLDVLICGLGSTPGLRRADESLAGSLRRAGLSVALVGAERPPQVPTMMLTDLLWARAARRAAGQALDACGGRGPRAVIYSSTTAATFWPVSGAIRFDALAAANRPGRHGSWQRPLERRRLRDAPLLLPWSEGALAEVGPAAGNCAERALVVPAAIELELCHTGGRDIAAVTYAGNPRKKGFDRVLDAWRRVRRPGEELVVVGVTLAQLRDAGFAPPGDGVRVVGSLPGAELREMLRRARVFVCAPRREDYGLIQLEALAAGCQLVTTPAPGPYVALAMAGELDRRLVGEDLGAALRAALDTPRAGYGVRAAGLVEPYGMAAVDRVVAERLVPLLFGERPVASRRQ
jgi:glycosyltransferase involved in cell wall biosynthesis